MEVIEKYFSIITTEQKQQFELLAPFYNDWNSKINVISRKDIENLYERHVLHSLAIAKFINFAQGTKIIDVGTGGGFPGIPLAILFPECSFTLIDSIGKKITVVENAIEAIGLKNVCALKVRSNELKSKFDFIISRAVSETSKFVADVRHLVDLHQKNAVPNGIIYLKGGDLTTELKPFKASEVYNLSDYYDEEFFKDKKLFYLPLH